eukprot:362523-Chlamydomonas_euryale.AAC.8
MLQVGSGRRVADAAGRYWGEGRVWCCRSDLGRSGGTGGKCWPGAKRGTGARRGGGDVAECAFGFGGAAAPPLLSASGSASARASVGASDRASEASE